MSRSGNSCEGLPNALTTPPQERMLAVGTDHATELTLQHTDVNVAKPHREHSAKEHAS